MGVWRVEVHTTTRILNLNLQGYLPCILNKIMLNEEVKIKNKRSCWKSSGGFGFTNRVLELTRIEERFEKIGSRTLGRTRLSGRSTTLERERKSANCSARAERTDWTRHQCCVLNQRRCLQRWLTQVRPEQRLRISKWYNKDRHLAFRLSLFRKFRHGLNN